MYDYGFVRYLSQRHYKATIRSIEARSLYLARTRVGLAYWRTYLNRIVLGLCLSWTSAWCYLSAVLYILLPPYRVMSAEEGPTSSLAARAWAACIYKSIP